MPPYTVLVSTAVHPATIEKLQDAPDAVPLELDSPDDFHQILPQVHAVLLGGLQMGPHEMDLAEKLLVIGRHGAGIDTVDVEAATDRGIAVVFTPYGPTESTAEHTLMLMLSAACRLSEGDRWVRSGEYHRVGQPAQMGCELEHKVLGVIGFGRIGRRLAEMCRDALHMPVLVYDPFLDPEEIVEWGATPVDDLLALARQVDVLTVHTPLTPDTHHLIDREVLDALKPTAILINASRGPVVDEAALVEVLQEGHLAGVGLDVFDPEPPLPDNPLFQFDRVVLTPHTGSYTDEGRRRMGLTVVEEILCVLRDERPQYLANPEVWPRRRQLEAD